MRIDRREVAAIFLGGFIGTVARALLVELLRMLDGHHYALALSYAAVSVVAGFLAVALATNVVRRSRFAP